MKENGFHKLRVNETSRIGNYKVEPSFLENLWECLEEWLIQIVNLKTQKKQARIIRYYDLWIHSASLKQLLDSQKPTNCS